MLSSESDIYKTPLTYINKIEKKISILPCLLYMENNKKNNKN